MSRSSVHMMLLYEKRKMLARQVKKKRPTLPVMLHPAGVERDYYHELLAYINFMALQTINILGPALPGLAAEAKSLHPVTDRQDSYADTLNALLQLISVKIDSEYPKDLKAMTLSVGKKTAVWNNTQWQKTVKKVMGVNTFTQQPWMADTLNAFSVTNVSLIKSLKTKNLTSIQTAVNAALGSGTRHEVISKQIQEQFKATKKQAKLIARDQVSKLNGQLTMLRQQDLGLNEYVWRTSGDKRVRDSHSAMEGKKCKWDDATVYWNGKRWAKRSAIGGVDKHPGQDYQCRCWPEAVLDPIYDEL